MKELLMVLDSIKLSQNIKALVITGEGGFFSSGHNLHEVIKFSDTNSKKVFSTASEIMEKLTEFPIPSIASVNGPAVAGGCQLVAACDLAISAKSAIFSASSIKLGLFCSTPGVSLVRAIGLRAANELLLTGKAISADRAYELGLVHRVVEDDKLYEASIEFAKEITQHNKDVVQLGRETLHKQASMSLMDAYAIASDAMVKNLQFSDTKQRIQSFLNRKK
ncbi:biogenesis of lysosome- organelles complex 1 subunit 2, variant 2 [Schistosoma haematobium]|uniref:Enoyl-CoA hydratase domain-containing protein 3, mitochondrial n=1 Tax=Schistosoma haematobium TaxID=6185 RepID=A0A922IK34_SCHHA|nr:biogenesis of lysosome- organelles complex 1 subunit 2, variant 2 [Schistosoma haematobium]KAH9581310.1 biogenesis of lysosome- organelles complex 1 subunit 2, variant 2 [Schistosoma haematobium]